MPTCESQQVKGSLVTLVQFLVIEQYFWLTNQNADAWQIILMLKNCLLGQIKVQKSIVRISWDAGVFLFLFAAI